MKTVSLKTQFFLWIIAGLISLGAIIFWVYPAYCTLNRKYEILGGLLCNELKITDVALTFFTYCLVIVGWFQIRSNSTTIRELERAQLFCGPISPLLTPDGTLMQFVVSNYGRTLGVIKEFHYEFSDNEPTVNTTSPHLE